MADKNQNPTPENEMSDNKQALIRNALTIHFNEKFNANNPKKKRMKNMKHNDIVLLLEAIGKADELMPKLQEIQKYKSINLSSYTKPMLKMLESHFPIDGMELDKETRQMMLVEQYGQWHQKEFPFDKKQNFTISNTTVSDLINFLGFKGIQQLPNFYELGIKNVKNYKPQHFDTKTVDKFEELFKSIEKSA